MFPQGHVFSGYKLLSDAKSGSFGEVYEAEDLTTSSRVALKFSNYAHDPFWYQRFENENKYLHDLSPHENIIKAYTHVKRDSTYAYYAMEFLDTDLEQYVQLVCNSDNQKKLELFIGICQGLKYAHSLDIFHRDLHSANIRLDHDVPKLTDFGLGKNWPESSNSSLKKIKWLGSAAPPESYFCVTDNPTRQEDTRRDIYALGLILFKIFSSSSIPYIVGSQVSILNYFLSIGAGDPLSYDKYRIKPETDRLEHYNNWLKVMDPNILNSLNITIMATDLDYISKELSNIIKKASAPDFRNRYPDVQCIIDDIKALMSKI